MKNLRPLVFFPPFALLIVAVTFSHFQPLAFLDFANSATQWILTYFGWLFNISTLCMVFICLYVYFSPIGKIRIGGEDAVPMLSLWRWFSILLCTTIAIGILFWGTAEPLYHFFNPPKSLGIAAKSAEAERFALSTMFMHWSFTPYCLYTIPALMAALSFYNLKRPYSLSSLIFPIFGKRIEGRAGQLIDSVCLFSLMAGMASALGAGILTIFGGLDALFDLPKSQWILFSISAAIVTTFCLSAATGLMNGIRILSDYNIRIFFMIAAFVFIMGPTWAIIERGWLAFTEYVIYFLPRSTMNIVNEEPWAKSWTIYYWANWMSWAPVTALFLGRLGYGYKVKTFVLMNAVLPSIFACVWMSIFSGTSLEYEISGTDLYEKISTIGPEAAIYGIFDQLPLRTLTAAVFVCASFLSFVTAADSNTEAMSGLSSTGLSPSAPNPPVWIKFVLGGFIGFFAWFMVSHNGIEGIKQLSNIGGLPALFLLILVSISLIKVASKPYYYIESRKGNLR